jgi:hypothetical protein
VSIDIFFQDLPVGVDDARDIPAKFVPGPIGSRADVTEALLAAAPIDFSGSFWGRIEGDRYSIEVNLGEDDPVMSFAFHARGSDLREVDLIVATSSPASASAPSTPGASTSSSTPRPSCGPTPRPTPPG